MGEDKYESIKNKFMHISWIFAGDSGIVIFLLFIYLFEGREAPPATIALCSHRSI